MIDEILNGDVMKRVNSLRDFLDDYGVSLERFLFDRNVVLHTGGNG